MLGKDFSIRILLFVCLPKNSNNNNLPSLFLYKSYNSKTADSSRWNEHGGRLCRVTATQGADRPKGLVGNGNKRDRERMWVVFFFLPFYPIPNLSRNEINTEYKEKPMQCVHQLLTLKLWYPTMSCLVPGMELLLWNKNRLFKMR